MVPVRHLHLEAVAGGPQWRRTTKPDMWQNSPGHKQPRGKRNGQRQAAAWGLALGLAARWAWALGLAPYVL